MAQLEVRVIPDGAGHRWMIVDHVWDGISAPIAIADQPQGTYASALAAGVEALGRIESTAARDHPIQD